MPRDGSGIYTYPPGSPGIPDMTIESAKYNGYIADIQQDLNLPRPIVAGGTGATNAAAARDNLDAERASQIVTNYDSHVFESGSFISSPGATSAPESAHHYAGTAVVNHAGQIYLEAFRYNPVDGGAPIGPKYIRQKWVNWSAWVSETGVFVDVTGDVMTGDLIIDKTQPTLWLDKPTDASQCVVQSTRNGLRRWGVLLADSATDDFSIWRYDDAGTLIGPCLQLNRATGNMDLTGNMHATGPAQFDGNLSIVKTAPTIELNKPGDASQCTLRSSRGGFARWSMFMGSGTASDNFELGRHNDAGVYQGPTLQIDRATNNFVLTGATNGITGNTTHTGTFTVTGQTALGSTLGVSGITTLSGGLKIGTTGLYGGAVALNVGYDNLGGGQYGIALRPTADIVNAMIFLNTAGTVIGSISQNATNTAYNTSSDERLKEDLKSFDAGNVVDDTNVYDFAWKATGERSYGILAQQAKDVYPAAVFHDEKTDWWGIDYAKYVPVLLQELKALRARVAELEGKVGVGVQPA